MDSMNTVKLGRDIDVDQDQTNSVTTWIRLLVIGMMVLGAVFATLDWSELLTSAPGGPLSCEPVSGPMGKFGETVPA